MYETLINDHDDDKGEFCLQVDGVQESCVGVSKKRKIEVQNILVIEVEYTFNDPNVQEILDTLLDFLTSIRLLSLIIDAP